MSTQSISTISAVTVTHSQLTIESNLYIIWYHNTSTQLLIDFELVLLVDDGAESADNGLNDELNLSEVNSVSVQLIESEFELRLFIEEHFPDSVDEQSVDALGLYNTVA